MKRKECICLNVRKTSRMISQAYDTALQPSGLRNTQFSVLRVLANTGPLPVSKLAKGLAMDRTTLTRNLNVLKREKLVDGRPGKDSRTRIIHLTEAGGRAFEAALPYWEEAQAAFLSRFGEDRWTHLLRDLTAARQILESDPET